MQTTTNRPLLLSQAPTNSRTHTSHLPPSYQAPIRFFSKLVAIAMSALVAVAIAGLSAAPQAARGGGSNNNGGGPTTCGKCVPRYGRVVCRDTYKLPC